MLKHEGVLLLFGDFWGDHLGVEFQDHVAGEFHVQFYGIDSDGEFVGGFGSVLIFIALFYH